VYPDVLLRRRNTLRRTMWDFPAVRASGHRHLVLGLGTGHAADLAAGHGGASAGAGPGHGPRHLDPRSVRLYRGAQLAVQRAARPCMPHPREVIRPAMILTSLDVLSALRGGIMTNVRYQARPAARRPRPVFWAVLCSVLAAMVLVVLYVLPPDWRWDSGTALRLVLPWYLLLASTCFLMERTAAANFTQPVRALRR
jgi:hypothetical protein